MKSSDKKNFEKELPEGYRQVLYINAKDVKFGILFNLISFVIMAAVMALAALPLWINGRLTFDIIERGSIKLLLSYLVTLLSLLSYIVLHELIHGVAYKKLTGEKLIFGMSWSCAFCGVPTIFTYKRCALISVLAPFVIFSLIFIPLTVALYFVDTHYYLLSALLLSLHLGGCCGDLYVSLLLLFKFKNKKLLMRDTGPEQFFYLPEN